MGSSQTLALKLWIAFVWYPFSGERFLIANFYKWRSYYAGKRPGIFLNDFRATENWDGGVYLNVCKEENKQTRFSCFVFAKRIYPLSKMDSQIPQRKTRTWGALTHPAAPARSCLHPPGSRDLAQLTMKKAYVNMNMQSLRSPKSLSSLRY